MSSEKNIPQEEEVTPEDFLREKFRAITELNVILSKTSSYEELWEKALLFGKHTLQFERMGIWLKLDEPMTIRGTFGINEDGEIRDERLKRLNVSPESAMGKVLSGALDTFFNNDTVIHNDDGNTVGRGQHAIAPLWNGEEILGLVSVDNHLSGRCISEEKVEVLKLFASSLAHFFPIKQANETLRLNKEQLDNIFNSIDSVLLTVDDKVQIIQWNHAAKSFPGKNKPISKSQNLYEAFPLLREYRKDIDAVISTRIPSGTLKLRGAGAPSVPPFLEVSIFPLSHSRSGGAVIRIDDITELELKDEQLRQAQKMETIGTLAGGLAHDFNNVLGGIKGAVSMVKHLLQNPETKKEDLAEFLEIAELSADRASDMVKQLMALSRKNELNTSVIELNSIIKNIIKICTNTFDKSVDITVNLSKEKSLIKADPTQIGQVIMNLCINALHAMTIMREDELAHGGELSISLSPLLADETFCRFHPEARPGKYWQMDISDTGIGISKEQASRIFDAFFTTKRQVEGTGLGLTMVYNIIKQHKGFIKLHSKKGVGSTFSIYLPEAVVDSEHKDKISSSSTLTPGKGTVLVADDEEIIRKVVSSILSKCGYEVILATNGIEAVEVFEKNIDIIDLIILDMAMPKMSGKSAYLKIKYMKPDAKILLTSGLKNDRRLNELLKSGAEHFIPKPFSAADLSDTVKNIIEN